MWQNAFLSFSCKTSLSYRAIYFTKVSIMLPFNFSLCLFISMSNVYGQKCLSHQHGYHFYYQDIKSTWVQWAMWHWLKEISFVKTNLVLISWDRLCISAIQNAWGPNKALGGVWMLKCLWGLLYISNALQIFCGRTHVMLHRGFDRSFVCLIDI